MVSRVIYDKKFDADELRRINRLRTLDDNRLRIGLVVGIVLVVVTFTAQIPFHGVDIVHAVATYGCIPAGIGVGLFTYVWLDSYIDRTFSQKWDPLFFERSGHGQE